MFAVQDTVSVVGRVCCDTVGKMNAQSVMLEGSRDTSSGRAVSLDLSQVPHFSLFPGQVFVEDVNYYIIPVLLVINFTFASD